MNISFPEDRGPRGISLPELTEQVLELGRASRDYIVPREKFGIVYEADQYWAEISDVGRLPMRPLFKRQLASTLNIPIRFYERAEEYPQEFLPLLDKFLDENYDKAMVRTQFDTARALLSTRYQRIDNWQVLPAVFDGINLSRTRFEAVSASLDEEQMWLKLVFTEAEGEVRPGDVVRAGIIVKNSEVGRGSVVIAPFLLRLICSNGMVVNELKSSRRHVGKDQVFGDVHILANDTLVATESAIRLQIRDRVKEAVDKVTGSVLREYVRKMSDAASDPIEVAADRAVDRLANTFELAQEERDRILNSLITGGELTRYGMANAVTDAAKSCSTYSRAVELESVGGRVIDLPQSQWRVLAA